MPVLHVYDYVNRPFSLVSELLVREARAILQRASTLHAHFGPLEVGAEIVLEVGPYDETPLGTGRPAVRVPVEWHARHAARAFPVMRAELLVYPLTPSETQLELVGTYEPPLGLLGRAIDSALLHRTAEESVAQFVREVAQELRVAVLDAFEGNDAVAG